MDAGGTTNEWFMLDCAGMAEQADAADLKVRAVSGGTPCSPRRSRDGTIPLRPSRDRGHVRHPTPRGPAQRQPPPLKLSWLKPYTYSVSSALDARAWRNGRRSQLEGNMYSRMGTCGAELHKVGDPSQMAVP